MKLLSLEHPCFTHQNNDSVLYNTGHNELDVAKAPSNLYVPFRPYDLQDIPSQCSRIQDEIRKLFLLLFLRICDSTSVSTSLYLFVFCLTQAYVICHTS